jgi:hypothetical protein
MSRTRLILPMTRLPEAARGPWSVGVKTILTVLTEGAALSQGRVALGVALGIRFGTGTVLKRGRGIPLAPKKPLFSGYWPYVV